jgi:competence protein ComEC
LLLDTVTLYGVAPAKTPERVRVTLRRRDDAALARVGATISVMAGLAPPPGPSAPGGFDFRRLAWFQGLGAVGTARGRLVVLAAPEPAALPLARARAAVSAHLRGRIGGEAGAFAAAIVTGDRGGIPVAALQNLRDAGLAHLLAISGLHMAIVGGLAFATLRRALALVPSAAERWPIKRVAAVGALAAAAGYLALSGGAIATQRAFAMAAVALGGVLVDRPAISLRGLCLAAFVLLLTTPEALLSAGFQMSFAATLALVAAYAAARRGGWLTPPRRARARVGRYLGALAATSAIAGLATAPYAAFHFGRLTPFGLLANLGAVPLMGLWVAPTLLLGGLLDLVGIGAAPLWLAGKGIDAILAIAGAVAALPGAVRLVPAAPVAVLALLTFGGLGLCLGRAWVGRLGAALLIGGLLLWPSRGDEAVRLFIASRGQVVALRGPEGLVPEHTRRGAFSVERWLRRDGDPASIEDAAARPGWLVDGVWRLAALGGGESEGTSVALTRAPRVFADEMARFCAPGALLIAPRATVEGEGDAPCLVLDAPALRDAPAIAVTLTNGQPRLIPAGDGDRPWTR